MKVSKTNPAIYTCIHSTYQSALFTTAAVDVGRNMALTKNLRIPGLILARAQHITGFTVSACYWEALFLKYQT